MREDISFTWCFAGCIGRPGAQPPDSDWAIRCENFCFSRTAWAPIFPGAVMDLKVKAIAMRAEMLTKMRVRVRLDNPKIEYRERELAVQGNRKMKHPDVVSQQ